MNVDDPSTDEGPVDANGPDGNDNRPDGTAVPAGGRMVQSVVIVSNGVAVADVELSRQPGNNFRVAVACDAGELGRLTVGGGGAGLIPVPANNEAELPGFAGRLTPMLTVWRRLHVELDSMAAVTNNFISGLITNISGGTTVATVLRVDQNLSDGSPLLPAGDGRFQNGWIRVGVGAGQTNLSVEANGTNAVRNLVTGFPLPFTITKPGRPTVTGTVREMNRGSQSVRVYLNVTGGQLTGAYKDGTITVAGVATNIVSVNPGQSLVGVPLGYALPFVLHDDDDDTLLPRVPDAFFLQAALADAYIVPNFNTPVISGYDQTNVPFRVNIQNIDETFHAQAWQSRSLNKNDFWVAYILNAFQGPTHAGVDPQTPQDSDNDPDSESLEVTVGRTVFPDGGSIVYRESLRDSTGNLLLGERLTIVHELGHAIGARGDEITDASGNLIGDGVQDGGRYIPHYLNFIRSSLKPVSLP